MLGVLLLHVGEVVSIEALIDGVWGEVAPRSARHMVHEYVSRIRSALGETLISTRAPGYIVERDGCELDVSRFAECVVAARSALEEKRGDAALRLFDEALGLWRGDVLSDLALEGDARAAAARLDDQRRAVQSERVDVALALGHHRELIPDLERAVVTEPLDERARCQLMLALYRDGRQTDALARYREGRSRLVEEFGIEPGIELRALEQAILQHDPELALPLTGETPSEEEDSALPYPLPARRRLGVAAAAVIAVAAALGTIGLAARNDGHPIVAADGDSVAVLDAATGRSLGSVPVNSRPGAITFGAGSVWVSLPDSRTVSRISPVSRQVVASIPLDVAAQGLASAGADVWAVGSALTDTFLTLDRIDPTFESASRVGRLPVVIAGDIGSVAGRGGTVFVAPRSGLLTRIDAHDGHTLGRVDPNASPKSIAVGFGSSWLAYREANLVVRVDRSGAITPIPVGRGPSAIAIGARAVWVANELDGTVKSIDPATSAVITTFRVGNAPSAIAAGGGSVWVANTGDGTLTRIDERTSRVARAVQIGGSPQALVVADGKVWATVQPPPPRQPTGGTAVVSFPFFRETFDPAESLNLSSQVDYATCAMLLNYPDEPGAAGLRLVPDAARALPTVSKDRRSYAFVLRPDVRFSPPSNQRVTAQTFKFSIERSLSPRREKPPGQIFLADVVGAKAYIAGKARHIAGITAR